MEAGRGAACLHELVQEARLRMSCDELLPNYLRYAAGKMEEPELGELRAHLSRKCEECTAGVRVARAFAYSTGAMLTGEKPSPQLRDRVLAMARESAAAARPQWRPR